MKITACCVLLILLCVGSSTLTRADTYTPFETKRFYSANAEYFVEVRPDKRATLYRMEPRPKQIWTRVLPALPARLFVSKDGKRVVVIDHYGGNEGKASAKVVLFFDEAGKQIADHELGNVAVLSRVLHTISTAHWYYGALFTPDEKTLIVETVKRCDLSNSAKVEECWRSDPFEELRFSMATGALISRADISGKYADREKRLLHELEFVLEEHPPDELNLAAMVLEVAKFYREQQQYAKAKNFYEEGIKVYSRKFGADSDFAADAMGNAAINYRKLGDTARAEELFRQSLNALDKDRQKRLENVRPTAITFYEEYAILLRELKRVREAAEMEQRAKVIRGIYRMDQRPK